jgi:hypothetical protein
MGHSFPNRDSERYKEGRSDPGDVQVRKARRGRSFPLGWVFAILNGEGATHWDIKCGRYAGSFLPPAVDGEAYRKAKSDPGID